MNARFGRVEKALATLVESITKYTPQTPQALELASADRELTSGFIDLQTHQNNHAHILALQAASDSLDAQIRDTLRLLWNTRKDITSTHVTKFPDGPSYDVNWEELLGYARRISKTTLPAPSILAAAAANVAGDAQAGADSVGEVTGDAVNTPNTTAAPTPAPGGGAATPLGNGAATPSAAQSQPQSQQPMQQTALPDEWARFLDPLTDQTFYPWPTEEKIRMGALASIQALLDQGIDPRGFDPAEEEARRQREEEMRREQEEKEAAEREDHLRRMREEQARVARQRQRERERAQEEAARRGSSGASASQAVGAAAASTGGGGNGAEAGRPAGTASDAAKRQFHFMGDDDDDDED